MKTGEYGIFRDLLHQMLLTVIREELNFIVSKGKTPIKLSLNRTFMPKIKLLSLTDCLMRVLPPVLYFKRHLVGELQNFFGICGISAAPCESLKALGSFLGEVLYWSLTRKRSMMLEHSGSILWQIWECAASLYRLHREQIVL